MDALMHMTDDDLKAMLIPMVSFMFSCHTTFTITHRYIQNLNERHFLSLFDL